MRSSAHIPGNSVYRFIVGDDTVIGVWDSTFSVRIRLVKMRGHWEKEDHIFGCSSPKYPGKCC